MDMQTTTTSKVRLVTCNVLLAELLKPFLDADADITLDFAQELGELQDLDLIVLDLGSLTDSYLDALLERSLALPTIALLNATTETALPWVERFPCIRGVFAPHVSREQLLQGLKVLLEGDDWLPRAIMAHLLRRSREYPAIPNDGLTQREREILQLVGRGLSNAAIGQALCVSTHTVKSHMHNLLRKTGAANRAEAALRFHAGQDRRA